MESVEISETIKEGSLEANLVEAKNRHVGFLEVSSEPVVCENGGGVDVGSSDKVVVSNVEVGKELGGEKTDVFCSEGFGAVKESLAGGNANGNEMDKGSLECYAEEGDVVLKDGNEVNNTDSSVLEVDTTANANLSEFGKNVVDNVDIGVDNSLSQVDEVKGKDVPQCSSKKLGVPGNGINLFVEVFGPLNGIKQSDEANCQVEHELEKRSSEQKNACEGNDTLLSDNGEKISADSTGDVIRIEMMRNSSVVGVTHQETKLECEFDGNLQCAFNMGDLVWVKTKTQSWWPGIISDPSNAAKDTAKRDGVLVKYFGSANLVWCSPSQLKLFFGDLEYMLKQNNSRSFLGATEKAIGEFGRRVKLEMTCSCFSEGSQRVAAGVPIQSKVHAVLKDKTYAAGAFSASQFESANFLASIRYLARCISMPGKLDFAITQNCLSAFYHSIGHLQLPMHQIRPTVEDKDKAQDGSESERKDAELVKLSGGGIYSFKRDPASTEGRDFSDAMALESMKKEANLTGEILSGKNADLSTGTMSENGYGSRERRKSKYLSFPYVDVDGGHNKSPALSAHETEDPTDGSCQGDKMDSISSQCAVSTPMTRCRAKTKKNGSRKPITDESTHSQEEIMNVTSIKILVDLHLTALNSLNPMKSESSDLCRQFVTSFRKYAFLNQEVENQQEFNHEIHNQDLPESSSFECQRTKIGPGAEGANFSGNDMGLEGGNPQKTIHRSKVNLKRLARKKNEVIDPSGPSLSPAGIGLLALGNDSQAMEFDASKIPKVSKKRKNQAEATAGVGLPDLNGINASLSNEDMHITGPAASQCKLKPKRRKRKDMLASGCMPGSLPQQNNSGSISGTATMCLNDEWTVRPSDATEHIVESNFSVRSIQHMDLLSPHVEPERKKRKRKAKTSNFPNTNGASAIPDLNGNVADSITSGTNLPGMSLVSPGAKPPRKRRRRKSSTATPDMNTNYGIKMGNHIEALEGILLLNFVPGSPLPSMESLVSTFSVFGALKESETQVLNDSSAQIVFVKGSDAGVAYRSLEKTNPFGPALASFRLSYFPSANLQMPQLFRSMDGQAAPANLSHLKPNNGDAPDLQFMKRNLDMMKSVLERAGDNLSPETKAKLESEIKGFMTKVSSLVGSSSS